MTERGSIEELRALKNKDINNETATPDTSPRPPRASVTTSTPYEDDMRRNMPTLNVSVINRCSLSTVAEAENEESQQNSRLAEGEASKRSSSKVPEMGSQLNLDDIEDPFTAESITLYFRKLSLPPSGEGIPQLKKFNKVIPEWIPGMEMNCGLSCSFMAGEYVDCGKFGKVFKLKDEGGQYAAKVQTIPFAWEFYILQLLRKKLTGLNLAFDLSLNIQEPRSFYLFNNGGILVSKFYNTPTMLKFQNHLMRNKTLLTELELIILLIELILIVENLHKCEVIHADLKPDNIMMRAPSRIPQKRNEFFTSELCFMVLIDFGKSIDMSMFPRTHKFTSDEAASNFTCTQMLEKQPWSYELDVFCVAATIHTMMFGKYPKASKEKSTGIYRFNETPKRGFNRDLWNEFFHMALNSPYKTALLPTIRDKFTDYVFSKFTDSEIKDSFYSLNKYICKI